MIKGLDDKATQAGFARLVGTSRQSISKRFSEGEFVEGETYQQWLTVYIERLRDEAAGRSDKELAAIRARKELAQARREELELSKEYKLVVEAIDLEPALVSLVKDIQSLVMEAGNKSLQAIESKHSIRLDDELILGHLRAALGNIAGGADQLIATNTESPCASVSAAITSNG